MTIDMLNKKTILVTLQQEDMRRYALDLTAHTDTEMTRRGLTELLCRVGEECGLDHRSGSYLIEALPSRDCCLLIISVRRTRRKKYRIKREKTRAICEFDTADAMLDWMESDRLENFGYTVYWYSGRYILIPDLSIPPISLGSLSEYGKVVTASSVVIARVREYGKLLKEYHTARHQFAKKTSSAAI